MSSPPAYLALGTELRISDGGDPEGFDAIPGCRSITGPGRVRDTEDVTSHSSTDGYREFITTLRDGGDVTCDVNWLYDDPIQLRLDTAFASNDPVNFQLFVPVSLDNNRFDFAGYVTALTDNEPIDGAAFRAMTVKITGPVQTETE